MEWDRSIKPSDSFVPKPFVFSGQNLIIDAAKHLGVAVGVLQSRMIAIGTNLMNQN
jgi:hypothetical protein